MSLNDQPVVLVGGIKINALENTSQLAFGDNFFQALDSQVKNNLIAGQVYGDFNAINNQPISSPIFDPDAVDTAMPMVMSPLGLED